MQAIILAAGESSRFWPLNSRHKSLIKIMGKPIIQWTLEGLKRAKIKDIIIVQGPKRDIENEIGDGSQLGVNLEYVVQKEPMGMGNAILCAENLIKDDFFVLNAERIDIENFAGPMNKKAMETGAKMVLLGGKTDRPWLYGILDVDGDKAVSITEKPKQPKSDIKAVGIYLVPKNFFYYYKRVKEHMYAFEDALQLYMKENDARVVMAGKETCDLKYPWNLFNVLKSLWGSLKSEIDETAEISKNVVTDGTVHVGKNTKVLENAVLKNCYIGDNCVIGNNSLIRDYTNIENNAVIGANCEMTRSIIQDNVHIHSGYIGDSIIGRNSRIGAGIITANVRLDRREIKSVVKGEKIGTGLKSFGTVVGEKARLGIRVSTMPGVFIGNDCVIGPNALIKKNVEDGGVIKS